MLTRDLGESCHPSSLNSNFHPPGLADYWMIVLEFMGLVLERLTSFTAADERKIRKYRFIISSYFLTNVILF